MWVLLSPTLLHLLNSLTLNRGKPGERQERKEIPTSAFFFFFSFLGAQLLTNRSQPHKMVNNHHATPLLEALTFTHPLKSSKNSAGSVLDNQGYLILPFMIKSIFFYMSSSFSSSFSSSSFFLNFVC